MSGQILFASIYCAIFLCIFLLAEMVRKYFPRLKEASRKTAHILCGLTALSFPYFLTSHWTVLGLVLLFSVLMLITKRLHLLKSIHEVGRKSYGSFYYPIAIYLIFFLASNQPVFYIISILVMAISDAFAALIGKKYGVIKYEIEGNTKSLEGSIVFFLISFLCVQLPLLLMTSISPANVILVALIIAILLTGFEAISPTGSDNIFIPFGTYFLLSKLAYLPLDQIVHNAYLLLIIVAVSAFLYMLKPTGLIGMMLLNYAAITLVGVNWFVPLFLTELIFTVLIFTTQAHKEKYPIRILFYLGIIPTGLIFLENALEKNYFIFIPYLVSIAGQLPLSTHLKKIKRWKGLLACLSVLFVAIPSIILYFNKLNLKALFVTIISIFIIYLINSWLRKLIPERNEFRLRFVSTAIGCLAAFFTIYLGTHYA